MEFGRVAHFCAELALRPFPSHRQELDPDQAQAALLIAGKDPPRKEPLDAVGLDEDECLFDHRCVPMCFKGRY